MKGKKGLGTGIEALFTDNALEKGTEIIRLRLSEIKPNAGQPRKEFDQAALEDLAQSIAQHGVLQPLLVRPMPDSSYQLVAGERRWRAARIAGLNEVPVVVHQMDDEQVMVIALIENLQREQLNPAEEARGYQRLSSEFGMTQEQIAEQVGKSRPAVANAMRLLGLPVSVLNQIEKGVLSAGHARAILSLGQQEKMEAFAEKAAGEKWSVRETEKQVKIWGKACASREPKQPKIGSPIAYELTKTLEEALGRKVFIKENEKGGSLTIQFFSKEDLADLAAQITGAENSGGLPD